MLLTGYLVFDLAVWLLAGGIVASFVGLAIVRVRECQIPQDVTAAELLRITSEPEWWK